MDGGITERYERVADCEDEDDLLEFEACGDGVHQTNQINKSEDFFDNHMADESDTPTNAQTYSSDRQTLDQNDRTLSSAWGSALSSPLTAECGIGSVEDIWKSALTSPAAAYGHAFTANDDDDDVVPTGPQQDIIEKRMSSFWAGVRERELTSKEEFLAAWTQNVEDIQQELVASQIQQMTEAMEDGCQTKADASPRDAHVHRKDELEETSASAVAAAEHDVGRQYPKWILFDQSLSPCPGVETKACANPFIEELDLDYPSPNSPTHCFVEELSLDSDDPSLRLHRSAGLMDVRRPNSCPTLMAKAGSGVGEDQLQRVEIVELFFHPTAMNTTGDIETSPQCHGRDSSLSSSSGWGSEFAKIDIDEQQASVGFSKTIRKGGGGDVENIQAGNDYSGCKSSAEEGKSKQTGMRKQAEVDSHEADGETGGSEEEDPGAPLVMEVGEFPKESFSTRLRRMLGLSPVWSRIQGFKSLRVPPCCSTNPAVVLPDNKHCQQTEDEDEYEENRHGVWSVRR